MIVWTEGRAVVLELRPGTETRIPVSRVPQAIEVLGIGSIGRRRARAQGSGLRLPSELLEADDATRAEASRMLQGSASHAQLATQPKKQPKKRRPR